MNEGARVGVTFSGSATGAVGAARETAAAIGSVRTEAAGLSAPLRTAERDTGRLSRGALAGSGALSGLGRSIAFASASFLGGAGLIAGLKGAYQQAETLEKAQRSLDVVIRRNNGDVAEAAPLIRKWAADQKQFGISIADSTQGLARAAAITGSVQAAMKAYDEALVISKATGKDFNAVLIAASKAQEGQTTALARYIGTVPKGTSTQQLYNDVMAKYRGQAQANTTANDRLHASLGNIELKIGQALMPVVQQYEGELDHWLSKSQNQKRITDDVTEAVHGLVGVLKVAHDVIDAVDQVTGGLGNTMKLLIGLKVASVLSGWTGGLKGLIGAEGAGGLAGAQGRSGGLLRNLKGLASLGAVTVGLDLVFRSRGDKGAKGFFESLFGAGLAGGALGFQVGGPWGAGLGIAIGVSADIFEHLIKGGPKGYKYHGGNELREVGHGVTYDAATGQYYWSHSGVMQAISAQRAGKITGKNAQQLTRAQSSEASKIVAEAKLYGVGSGGTYKTGGGHGGSVAPGSVLDCSGYVYQVFTHAGFKNFPGTSEQQWRTHSGFNWTSEHVSVADAKPGDVVFMVGSPEYPSPGHVGVITSGAGRTAEVMQYYQTGKPPDTIRLDQIGDLVGIKRFFLVKKGSTTSSTTTPSGSPFGTQPPPTTTPPSTKKSTYKVPVALENKIRKAQAAFRDDMTKANLDYLLSLYQEEDRLAREHGKAQPAIGEIAAAKRAYDAHLKSVAAAAARQAAKVAAAVISKIEAEATGPSNTLKLAQAAGASVNVILADQQGLLAAYRTEARQLKAKLAKSTGEAKARYKAALTKIDGLIASTQDGIVGSLQSLYQTAEANVGTILGNIQTAADQALGAQYFQGGLQAPAEAALAAMQAQDTANSLQDALAQAQQQLQKDTGSGADAATLAADQQAIDSANRAIEENQLAIEAAKERADADSAYAKAVYNLNQSLASAPQTVAGVNSALGQFGLTLGGLVDPGGNGLLDQFTAAVDAAATALNDLTVAAGGTPAKSTRRGKGGAGGSTTPAPPVRPVPAFATGGLVPGPTWVNRDTVPAFLTPGEYVLERGLSEKLDRFLDGVDRGLAVAGPSYFQGATIHTYGATEHQVGRALARMVSPALRRQVGFNDY